GRHDDLAAGFGDLLAKVVGVVALVSDGGFCGDPIDQRVRKGDVVALAGGADQSHRVAQRIAGHMDLGAQAATGAPKALGIRPPFCRRAPAPCEWARTIVESVISHSRSASRASASRMPSSTPISIQR